MAQYLHRCQQCDRQFETSDEHQWVCPRCQTGIPVVKCHKKKRNR